MQKRIAYQDISDKEHRDLPMLYRLTATLIFLSEGLVANVITMKKEWIFQWDGFLYKTHKGHGPPLGLSGSGTFLVVAWTSRFYRCH